MVTNIRIVISITLVFVITFSALAIIENQKEIFVGKEQFFLNDFSKEYTIFMVGSSQIGAIDVTQVENLVTSEKSLEIYNLVKKSDTPAKRLKDLEGIILSKPDLVLYGISYRDFSFPHQETTILPNPQHIMSSKIYSNFEDVIPSDPKSLTGSILTGLIFQNFQEPTTSTNPFYQPPINDTSVSDSKIRSDEDLPATIWNDLAETEKNMDALHKIISKLQDKEIKIVIFTLPLHSYYLETLSDYQKNNFLVFKNDLKNKYNLEIYEFEGKYIELDVWRDPIHMILNKNVTIFNSDIANIINIEMES